MKRSPLLLMLLAAACAPAHAAFTHSGGVRAHATSAATVTTAAISPAPAQGDTLLFAVHCTSTGVSLTSVKDANNNAFSASPNSPSSSQGASAGVAWVGYLASAPSNIATTFTATMGANCGIVTLWVEDFSVSGGAAAFDTDVAGSGTTGTTVNTPSITGAAAGELLWATATIQHSISAVGGSWTQAAGGIDTGGGDAGDAEYVVSSSGSATAVNFTQTSGSWDSLALAMKLASTTCKPTLTLLHVGRCG